ncbi:hypothetical protein K3495_g1824 [Podosphaera aphanis]|nr:hypothetical protein K3495_g1824 [Podosphaera aphanis]
MQHLFPLRKYRGFKGDDFLGSDYVVINKETGFAQAAVTEKTTPVPSTSSTVLNEALNRTGKRTWADTIE